MPPFWRATSRSISVRASASRVNCRGYGSSPMQCGRRACGRPCPGRSPQRRPCPVSGTDAHRGAVLHVENGIARHSGFHEPAEEKVVELPFGGRPRHAVLPALVRRLRGEETRRVQRFRNERSLRDDPPVDEALEVHVGGTDKRLQARHGGDAHHAEVLPPGEDIHDPRGELGRHDHFGIGLHDELRGLLVQLPVQGDGAAEGGEPVGHVCLVIGLCKRLSLGDATGIVVLHDDGARGVAEVAQDRQGIVASVMLILPGCLPGLEELDVGGRGAGPADTVMTSPSARLPFTRR